MKLLSLKYQLQKLDWLIITKIIVGFFILFAFYQNCRNNIDPDLGWHLRIGNQILETKSVPRYDNLTFTMPGYSWVDHEWLTDALLAQADHTHSWHYIIIISTLIAFIPFLWWLKKSTEVIESIPLLIAALAWGKFIAIRPQIISFLFFFIVLQTLSTLNLKNRSLFSGHYRFVFPLLFFIWANVHAGFFSGLILLSVYIFVRLIHSKFFQKIPYTYFLKDCLCLAFCTLVPLLNPYGLRLYQEIFAVSTNYQTLHYVQEWFPLYASLNLPLILFVGIFINALILYSKKYPPVMLFVSLFFFIMSIRAIRMFPFFIITAVPLLLMGFKYFIQNLRKAPHYSKKKEIILRSSLFSVIFFLLSFWLLGLFDGEKTVDNSSFPHAIESLKNYEKEHSDIKMFNEYAWSGSLAYTLPEIKLFIDGRMPHWKGNPYSAMEDYTKVIIDNDWHEVFDRRGINLVFIRDDYSPHNNFLEKIMSRLVFFKTNAAPERNPLKKDLLRDNWHILYEDTFSILLIK